MNNKSKAAVIGKMAADALRAEAAATPKPGLVDMENSGAHRDMDYPLFLTSCSALEPYFAECAEIGSRAPEDDSRQALQSLREAGLEAEKAMFSATGGVNTHKGLIFSMGILCFCLGENPAPGTEPALKPALLQDRCAGAAAALLSRQSPADTHGAQVLKKSGVGGIRAEALSGFDSAFSIGYPALKEAVSLGFDENQARIYALLRLMKEVGDSNVVYRGGKEGLSFIREKAAEILAKADLRTEVAAEMVRAFDRACIERNLSPGGSADLLAISIMLYDVFVLNAENRKV